MREGSVGLSDDILDDLLACWVHVRLSYATLRVSLVTGLKVALGGSPPAGTALPAHEKPTNPNPGEAAMPFTPTAPTTATQEMTRPDPAPTSPAPTPDGVESRQASDSADGVASGADGGSAAQDSTERQGPKERSARRPAKEWLAGVSAATIIASAATIIAALTGAIVVVMLFTMQQAFNDLRADIAELRAEIADVRTELKADIAALRTELKADIADVRTEIADVRTELKADIADVRTEVADLREDLNETDTRLTVLISVLNARREVEAAMEGRLLPLVETASPDSLNPRRGDPRLGVS